ncbi:hypothetical protein EDB83DRAFT_2317663 [Lactarius deliciosus]|nr:hypothetical protein EDB83DRAFT_2317663 [Lactarius deliciosus]
MKFEKMSRQAAQRIRRATAEHVGSKVYLPLQSEKQRKTPSLDPHVVIGVLESHLAETRVLHACRQTANFREITEVMAYVNGEDERREQDRSKTDARGGKSRNKWKGYKIDYEKLQANFRRSEEDPEYVRFLYLWQKFPVPFLYLATVKEPGKKTNLVVVLADGYDKAMLDEVPVVELSEPYTTVFTKGVWVKDA